MVADEMREKLIKIALEARKWSYSPYSKYPVGAALLTKSDRIYDGANIENIAYPSSMCAERVAIFKAASEGEREFEAIAVVTADGGTPCGSCRQVLAEFSPQTLVIIADEEGKVRQELKLEELLPDAFSPLLLKEK